MPSGGGRQWAETSKNNWPSIGHTDTLTQIFRLQVNLNLGIERTGHQAQINIQYTYGTNWKTRRNSWIPQNPQATIKTVLVYWNSNIRKPNKYHTTSQCQAYWQVYLTECHKFDVNNTMQHISSNIHNVMTWGHEIFTHLAFLIHIKFVIPTYSKLKKIYFLDIPTAGWLQHYIKKSQN